VDKTVLSAISAGLLDFCYQNNSPDQSHKLASTSSFFWLGLIGILQIVLYLYSENSQITSPKHGKLYRSFSLQQPLLSICSQYQQVAYCNNHDSMSFL